MKQNATLDSSFWINAHRSGLLPYLLERYVFHYPPAVALELRQEFPSGREFWRMVRQGTLSETAPGREEVTDFGFGERAALNLAMEHRDWVLLVDDRRSFLEAARLGLNALCTPVLVVHLFIEERIDSRRALEILARLAAMQTVSPSLLAVALAQLGRARKEKGGS